MKGIIKIILLISAAAALAAAVAAVFSRHGDTLEYCDGEALFIG